MTFPQTPKTVTKSQSIAFITVHFIVLYHGDTNYNKGQNVMDFHLFRCVFFKVITIFIGSSILCSSQQN